MGGLDYRVSGSMIPVFAIHVLTIGVRHQDLLTPFSTFFPFTPTVPHRIWHSEGGLFKARLTFPLEYPLLPPKMRFITPMWHPNSEYFAKMASDQTLNTPSLRRRHCVHIDLGMSYCILIFTSPKHEISMHPEMINMDMKTLESDGCLCTRWKLSYVLCG
jgi:hypothetical protein